MAGCAPPRWTTSATASNHWMCTRAKKSRCGQEAPGGEKAVCMASHCWRSCGGVVRCDRCWAMRSETGRAVRACCPGKSALHCDILEKAPGLGHELFGGEVVRPGGESGGLLICFKCGHWAEAGASKPLHQACMAPGAHGLNAIGRVRRGLHPRPGSKHRGAVVADLVPAAWLTEDD